ncbi:MAG: hypothetical protein JXR51_07605 [Bacteroidales bacterium]|nr:hypothetical protein [Bacteroidales bacterium]MBN2757029.1 hypothetical protein [Bacteroidales bacterium]
MEVDINSIKIFIDSIKENSNYDFSNYSEKSLSRRIDKILFDNRMSIEELAVKISKDKEFIEKIIIEVTVNTTEIFRDAKTWQLLKYKYIDELKEKEKISIWDIGCSTGQEVYSMLILLNEKNLLPKAEILATDLNSEVLKIAEKGVYKFREIDEFIDNYELVMCSNPYDDKNHIDIPHKKYFEISRRKNLIKIKPNLLNKIAFLKHDIIQEKNIFDKKFDIIFCRNVLIYFKHDLQNKLFDFFYQNLNDDGLLIIGRHEGMLGPISNKFKKEESIYKKL